MPFAQLDAALAKAEALTAANAHLSCAGMPTYTELVELLNDAAHLGLIFDIGSAYIRRAHIDKQDALRARIKAVNEAFLAA